MLCTFVLAGALFILAMFATEDDWASWPPRDYLLQRLVAGIPEMMDSFHPDTGRFGTKPWICNDQNVIYPLAAAWSIEDDENPYYHDDELLNAIAKGGEALVEAQDEDGAWVFRKKDGSTWGQVMQPWTYSRWIRAFYLTGDALPEESRRIWEEGFMRGYTTLREHSDSPHVHNMSGHNQMGLYIAGICFDNEDWKQAAAGFLRRLADAQHMPGYWSEHYGPVVSYNRTYIDLLGVYYSFSRDDEILYALERAADFHRKILFPDGSYTAAIDERNPYRGAVEIGNVGFSWTPHGRGYLLKQLKRRLEANQDEPDADYAAHMLLHSGEGDMVPLEDPPASDTHYIRTVSAVVKRQEPWQWVFSGYACEPALRRWVQDRQNLVDVYHDDLGLVAGGGSTKLQPYWSTFTVGDTGLLRHTPGDTDPDFDPDIDLQWTPKWAILKDYDKRTKLSMKYTETGGQIGYGDFNVTAEAGDDGTVTLIYQAPAGQQVEAHLPLLLRGDTIKTGSGEQVTLGEEGLRLEDLGGSFVYEGLKVEVPEGAYIMWPAVPHDPYKKDGSAGLDRARPVLCMPFDDVGEYRITLSRA
ncbi:MAG: hypothetical protein R6V19_15915 [Armatimonadota bacterium]